MSWWCGGKLSPLTPTVPIMTQDAVDDPADDSTGYLAEALGLPSDELARSIGAGWRLAPGPPFDWYVAGIPVQLMARLDPAGLVVAIPAGTWDVHRLVLEPRGERLLTHAELRTPVAAAEVGRLVRRRRASLRYCRYCRRSTPPEERLGEACMACATRWEHVVF